VRGLLPHLPFEIEQQLHRFQRAIAVLVPQAIQAVPFRSHRHDVYVAIEWQDALHILHLVAVAPHFVHNLVVVRVHHQKQPRAFPRENHMPELVECHRQHRTCLLGVNHPLHRKVPRNAKAFPPVHLVARRVLLTIPRGCLP